jgi:hypothetical protein
MPRSSGKGPQSAIFVLSNAHRAREEPPASAGYRDSDLMPWRFWEMAPACSKVCLRSEIGTQVSRSRVRAVRTIGAIVSRKTAGNGRGLPVL